MLNTNNPLIDFVVIFLADIAAAFVVYRLIEKRIEEKRLIERAKRLMPLLGPKLTTICGDYREWGNPQPSPAYAGSLEGICIECSALLEKSPEMWDFKDADKIHAELVTILRACSQMAWGELDIAENEKYKSEANGAVFGLMALLIKSSEQGFWK